jgi:hypothetical protein
MNPTETDNIMKAIEAPIFMNLEQARQWVNEQALDEVFYLVEFHASKAYIEAGRKYRGDTPANLYEFFNLTEYNEMVDNQAKLRGYGALRRQVRLIERWS